MRFVLFTHKPIPECMRELNSRIQAKPTKTRPELQGWIDKSGKFSIVLTAPVIGRFSRSTKLRGSAKRENGMTVIRGHVADGISPQWLTILMAVIFIVALALMLVNEAMLAVIVIAFGVMAYIPMRGDYINSDLLLLEVEKTLKASPAPKPKPKPKATPETAKKTPSKPPAKSAKKPNVKPKPKSNTQTRQNSRA